MPLTSDLREFIELLKSHAVDYLVIGLGELDGLAVPFISGDRLIQNKVAAGRTKDLADLKRSRKRRHPILASEAAQILRGNIKSVLP